MRMLKGIAKSSEFLKRHKYIRKILFYSLLILLLWILYLFMKEPALAFIKSHPTLWMIYSHLTVQIKEQTYMGLFYFVSLGSTVLLSLPIEIVSGYYFHTPALYNPLIVGMIVVLGTCIGFAFNYVIGFLLGKHILKWILKEKYDSFEDKVVSFGGWIVFIMCLVPFFPADIFILIYGSTRYPLWRLLKIIAVSTAIKTMCMYFFLDYIITQIGSIF